MIVILAVMSMFSLIRAHRRHLIQFKISEINLNNLNEIEDFINLWNRDYFIPNGVYVTCPRNMAYVQFNVGLKSLMLIDRHEYPFTFN
jgi:hypothetical protein